METLPMETAKTDVAINRARSDRMTIVTRDGVNGLRSEA